MQQPDMQQLLSMIRSPAGQQLLEYLNKNGGSIARSAAAQASAGDVAGAKSTLAPLMEDAQFQALLRQLGGNP